MSIRRRISIVAAVAVAITVFLVAVGAFLAARKQVLAPIDKSLIERVDAARRVRAADIQEGRLGRPTLGLAIRPSDFDSVYYQIGLADGRTLNLGRDELVLPTPSSGDLAGPGPTLRSVWVDDVHLRIAAATNRSTGMYVQIARPLTEADATLASFAAMLAFGGLFGIALALGLGLLVSRNAVKPIDALRRDVSEIARTGELTDRIEVVGDDEVAELARAFNELLGQLEHARSEQVRLVRDAGHELRTPLTALRMNLEMLQRHDVERDDRQEMLSAATEEVEELSHLVTEIVDLATDRYEAEPITDVDLGEIAQAALNRVRRRNGRAVEFSSDGSSVRGRREALERAVTNIVTNADKWSPEGAAIAVEVSDNSVIVRDHGPGIADEDLPHVFDRFYRADAARTTPGSGLGLSIVEQIVSEHGGRVFASNAKDGGALVGFAIPSPE